MAAQADTLVQVAQVVVAPPLLGVRVALAVAVVLGKMGAVGVDRLDCLVKVVTEPLEHPEE